MYLAIALVAALLEGVGFVLQQHAAEQVPKSYFLHLRLITELLRKPRWLIGMAAMVIGQVLSAVAVGHLRLSLAEPLLTTSLLFALLLAVPLARTQLRRSEIVGAVLLMVGVSVLSLVRTDATAPLASFGSSSYWWSAAVIALISAAFVQLGRRRAGNRRAILTGIGCGLLFGISDALTRRSVQMLDGHQLISLLTSWPGYSMVAATVLGIWLMESAFNAGPLHESLPMMMAGEPLAGMALGVIVFGDKLPVSPGMLALQAAGIVAMIIGVILVARAPVFADLKRVVTHPTGPHPILPQPRRAHPGRPRASKPHASQPHGSTNQPAA